MKNTALAKLAYDAASGVYGPSTYRRDNNGTNYGAEYNVGTWYNGHWCSDCLGFVHIMVNGFKGDKSKVGGGAVMDDFVWNSDEATTLNKYCTIKGRYPKTDMKVGSLLQSYGHVGLYIGDGFDKRFNTAECTTAKGGGWVKTWTDLNTGYRYSEKGGYYISSWQNWGQFDRVDYTEEKPIVYPELPFAVKVLIDDLNIRKQPSASAGSKGYAAKGNHIVDEVKGYYGYVEKLAGWIYLAEPKYVKIGEHIEVSPWKDIKTDDPNYKYFKKVYEAGLMKGYSNGKFKPKAKVTRQQLAIVLAKLLDMK